MEVVLPNGKFVTVNEHSYPDLFWALRGAGGSKFLSINLFLVNITGTLI